MPTSRPAPPNLHEEAKTIHWVRHVCELLTTTNLLCNVPYGIPKRVSREKVIELEVELLSRNPRPVIEHLNGGRLRRATLTGDGTKKSPYRAEWRDDYFIDT